MRALKSLIPMVIIFILIFSTIGTAFADIYVEVNPTTANVGDTVTITVSASNDDIFDWCPVVVYAPIPDGLQYMSHVVPDRLRQDYDPNTGIWDVNRMRHDERGHLKYLIITTKVLPEAAGEPLTATARFQTLIREYTGEDITSEMAPSDHTMTINPIYVHENETKEPPENDTDPGPGEKGPGHDLFTINGNSRLANAIGNLTPSDKNELLRSLEEGGGGKAYEITNATNQNQTPENTLYALLSVLALVILIAIGYFKQIRK